jgi:hypothetical protein
LTSTATPTSVTATPTSGSFRAAAVSLGTDHTCAIDTEEKLYCWGRNNYAQVQHAAFDLRFFSFGLLARLSRDLSAARFSSNPMPDTHSAITAAWHRRQKPCAQPSHPAGGPSRHEIFGCKRWIGESTALSALKASPCADVEGGGRLNNV